MPGKLKNAVGDAIELKNINFKRIILFFVVFLFFFFRKVSAIGHNIVNEGFYQIESLVAENKAVDIGEASPKAETSVWLWDKNDSLAQIFYIAQADDGFFEIRPVCSGMALDVAGAEAEQGTNVWQYPLNSTDAQRWSFENCYDDVFVIRTKLGDFCLDVEGADSGNGTNIRIWEPNYTCAQKFRFKKVCIESKAVDNGLETFFNLSYQMDYSKKPLRLREYFFKRYTFGGFKNVLVLGDDDFLKSFNEIFKEQTNFKFDLKKSLESVENKEKYDFVINEKYKECFLKCIFPNTKIETFRQIYSPILYQAVIDYLSDNKIPIYFFEAPKIAEMKNCDAVKSHIINGVNEYKLYERRDLLDKIFGDNEDCKNYFTSLEFSKTSNITIKIKNHFAIADFKGKYCNIIDHHRFVKSAPEKYKNTIYMYGSCTMRSKHVSDNYTIESFMQKHLNDDFPNIYNCIGYGVEASEINDFEYILDTDFKPGDIIIEERAFSEELKQIIKQNRCKYASLSVPLDDADIGTFSIGEELTHFNHIGCKTVADYIYGSIKNKLDEFSKCDFDNKIITFGHVVENDQFIKDNPDFVPWLNKLKSLSKPYIDAGKKIGSLNVNCNPFTKGHRYLIEESLKKVDHLFIFVVEEDASEFSFKDRYEMVKRGVADLDNITLLTTGKWMCSKFTFPDYFDKEALQSKIILNPTKDIELYGKYIAPAIGATIRFAGEEPLDLITRQHNNFMKEKFPYYGIEFCEIPRKTLENGQVISASKVRKYLEEKNFEELAKLVPKTTYDYLIKNFT